MKDKKLEQQFNEYFDGIEVPANLAEDAKKFVKKPEKSSVLPRFLKIASVAASFIVCFAVIFALVLRFNPPVGETNKGDGTASEDSNRPVPPSSGDNGADEPSASDPAYYGTDDITFAYTDPYTISGGKTPLKFIEALALADNAYVTAQTATFEDGSEAFAYAEVTLISGVRDETKIYVEFTDGVYEELKAYREGEKINYGGITFYLTQETDDYGEPVSKVFTQKGGVKYYFAVTSSDTQSYIKYLQLIYKNF